MESTLDIVEVGKLVHVKATGKLTKESYEVFVPVIEKQIAEHGKLRILFEMHDFHGWTMSAAWEDMKFDYKHWNDIERLAIVGESKWEEGMASFCKPFTGAKVKYFDHTKLDEAKAWLAEE
ncbi:STAS/SEC14 domain-containing protein [Blastopirellula sp. JC732]|uniref:STAS/SEC14 domain-containing protein n=1 Tax=Blastopirellula sediminis TaxID=2894196 RepID=A0A9X1SGA1_9BACT|nr:STAS/SEC14 domain-containing protein [Blastopirellula sediminis]MCC9608456.1 STAS/SEC14 domain-containing protein [Blastopirellula sediminis]MCC9628767.1 STAS/SEC14 domain-containing protein [Blastopirellula sediminis]